MNNSKSKHEFFARLIELLNDEDIINGVYVQHKIHDRTLALEVYSFRAADAKSPYVWLYIGWYEVTALLERWGLIDRPQV